MRRKGEEQGLGGGGGGNAAGQEGRGRQGDVEVEKAQDEGGILVTGGGRGGR